MMTSRNVPLRGIADSTKRESAPPASVCASRVCATRGAQAIENSSGLAYGPTAGTPGGSLGLTYSWCGSAP